MSTHWGYRCMTHDVSSENWLNHGEAALVDLLDLRTHVAAITRAGGNVEAPEVLGAGAGPAYFITEHETCNVWLENEYGDLLTPEEVRANQRPAIARGVRVDDLRLLLNAALVGGRPPGFGEAQQRLEAVLP